MNRIAGKTKFSIGLLAFLIGVLISSFDVSIPTIERAVGLRIASIQWLEIMIFLATLVSLFPALHFTQKFGPKAAIIASSVCILIASLWVVLEPNQYFILLCRVLDGFAAALMLALIYFYANHEKLSISPLILIFALGLLFGPFLAHYHTHYQYGMLLTYTVFFILPLIIMFCGLSIQHEVFPKLKKNKSIHHSLCLLLMTCSLLFIFVYYDRQFLSHTFIFACLIVFALTFAIFIYQFSQSHEREYMTKGIPNRINCIIALNVAFISTYAIFWATTMPIYLVQVSHIEIFDSYFILFTFNLAFIIGGYLPSLYHQLEFQFPHLTMSYLVLAFGTSAAIFFWHDFQIWNILFVSITLGFGLGLSLISIIELIRKYRIPAPQILINMSFYFCVGILLGYIPISTYFYYLERSYNKGFLNQLDILLPQSMATPTNENFSILSGKAHFIHAFQSFSSEQVSQLEHLLKVSFIHAIHDILGLIIMIISVVLIISIMIFRKQIESEVKNQEEKKFWEGS